MGNFSMVPALGNQSRMRRSSKSTSQFFKEHHKKQSISMKIERGESEYWRIFLRQNPSNAKAPIRDLQKTDTFNPLSEESKEIIHNLVISSTSNCVKSLRKHNARPVRDIGQMGLCIAHANTGSLRNNVITIRQRCVYEKRKTNNPILFLRDFQKQESYRKSHMAIGWTEEMCRYLDQLALEDKSYTATRRERQRHENNW